MSTSTHVIGFKAPDEKWKKMKKIYDSCTEAKIAVPDKVLEFFAYDVPDDEGVRIELEDSKCTEEWNADMRDGFVIDVKALLTEHPDITHIRFYNSY